LSKAGVGSRVEARSWVRAGRVTVNGTVTRNPDHWIDMERDRVRFDDKPLVARERLYLLLHKPTSYLTTYRDPGGRPTVYDLIADVGTFLSPVGRLDRNTSGLLLMTNDNRFGERVTNPTSRVPKTYLVTASTVLSDAQLQQLRDACDDLANTRRRRHTRAADIRSRVRTAGIARRPQHLLLSTDRGLAVSAQSPAPNESRPTAVPSRGWMFRS
jgi:16S rRNA U516 pseudouridylate synthase RsuA-like enzyme